MEVNLSTGARAEEVCVEGIFLLKMEHSMFLKMSAAGQSRFTKVVVLWRARVGDSAVARPIDIVISWAFIALWSRRGGFQCQPFSTRAACRPPSAR